MPAAKDKTSNIHDQMPAVFNTQTNVNWKALISAIGTSDQETLDLIESIRQQFFIKTASRPYIDRLGAANLVQRPNFVGMDDTTFREFIPVMSYQPKQVKLVLDKLLDLFFFKDSTTSYIASSGFEPFALQTEWELEYSVDSYTQERIQFNSSDFTSIGAATANEIVAAINRQAKYSYAVAFNDSITQKVFIRIFTNTVGSKGSIQITGGRANIALQFEGFNVLAGQGGNSQYTITKIGDTVTMQYTGVGNSPNISALQVDDVVIICRAGNSGSFVITRVDATNNSIQYTNLLATPETFTQTIIDDVKFMTPFRSNIYLKDRRAIVWEVKPGEIVVEMPPSPPVVKRNRRGSAHINGVESLTTATSTNTLTLEDASSFPNTGKLLFVPLNEIQTSFPEVGDTILFKYNSQLSSDKPIYTYTGKTGNTLTGITPALPLLSSLNQVNLTSADRDGSNIITAITATVHNYLVGDTAIIYGATSVGPLSINGAWKITEIVSSTQFKAYSFAGPFGATTSTGGNVRTERPGMAQVGNRVILRSAQLQPDSVGPYLWDQNASFILSSLTTTLTSSISAGTTNRNVQVNVNDIPDAIGQVIFDYGTAFQEGPVRYFYKPNTTSIAIDPAYVFNFTHDIGSSMTMIRNRGGIQFGGLGSEYAPYVTDPASARVILQELLAEVKSVGVFMNFLIRYPTLYYGTIDVYTSGIDPDMPLN